MLSESAAYDEFLTRLRTVPWFSRLGQPTDVPSAVARLSCWEDWPGPEELSVIELSFQHQDLYDAIMQDAGPDRGILSEHWDRIHAEVFRTATAAVPFDANGDAWHAPTTAVWQAAWTAGLVGLFLLTGRPVPPNLQEQWDWYSRGHWPSGYTSDRGKLGPLLVY